MRGFGGRRHPEPGPRRPAGAAPAGLSGAGGAGPGGAGPGREPLPADRVPSGGARSLTPGFLYADAVRVLSYWRAPDDDQERMRLEFLRHLEEHPANGMWRECAAGHITASTAVLDTSRSRVLLTLHAKLKSWLQLGGHCEPGDVTLAGAALREATEESGIPGLRLLPEPVQLDRHAVPCHPGGSWHLDVQYVAVAAEGARHAISAESDDLAWFPVDALPERTDDVVRRLVARAVRVRG